ncbi:hybrid sensor histidine kinase/response regulator [Synoicihabitans lomoniglobus]|uniref:histidine kinase n=1 Tax=Synoicihabitans lomoniglobus TaxID=2909285 RepID=A0AAF0CP59_9BACT|nr:ATP-binding protein [Opitutaceae bacterium LMO-M01]WED63424.1 ATP-binding protein [Opitutaceae bacterium LMO-M01]
MPLFRPLSWLLLLAFSAGVRASAATDELGIPVVDAFSVRDYGAHNQNWTAVQDAAGVLYVGNKDRVLAYDGQSWQSIPTGGLFIRGLAVDATDRIWVGGVDELGYLEPDGAGSRRYVSLREHLPVNAEGLHQFFFTLALSHGVYFAGDGGLLRWHDNELTQLMTEKAHIWAIDDELIASSPGLPLRGFNGESWRVLLANAEILDDWITFGAARPDGSQLLFTLRDGIHHLHHGEATPWSTEIDAHLQKFVIRSGTVLSDGTIALRMRQGGTVLLSPEGKLLQHLSAENQSVPVTNTLGFGEGRSGDLWLTQNSGLARIRWPQAITHFDQRRGLGTNTVKAITRYQGRLYVATGDGLSVLRPRDTQLAPPTPAHFEPVAGSRISIWALTVAAGDLLIGGEGGIRVLGPDDETAKLTIETDFGAALLTPRSDPSFAWAGLRGRLLLLRKNQDGWQVAISFNEVNGSVRALAEDADGAIWVAMDGQGYHRLERSPHSPIDDPRTWTVEHYAGGHGLPTTAINGLPSLATRGTRAVFIDDRRLFTFDPVAKRFEEVLSVIEKFDHPISNVPTLAAGLNGSIWVRTLRDDPEAGPWNGRVYWRISADGTWEALPFALAERVGENPMFFEEPTADGSVLWMGGNEGLVRAELPAAFLSPRSFRTVVRRVATLSGELLPLATAQPIALPFDQQGLAIAFATDRTDDSEMRYQSRLSDYGEAWSPLSRIAEYSLNRQPVGEHVFEVRACDSNGRWGEPASFAFTVLPPWWQSWWARTLTVLELVGLIALAVRWRLRAVQRRNDDLAALVEQRTQQLRHNETQLVQARDTADAANHAKSEFLASMSHELRTPLNAILGFTQILRREEGLSPKGRTQLDTVGRNGRHLLEMINEVLDLSKIEANKLTLHPAPCSLRRLTTELAATFEPRATEKGLSFRIELDPSTPRVMADEPKLRQVLINLLANAVKFTRTGEVVLALHTDVDRVRFEVRDTGVGIADQDLASVFEPFHQTQKSLEREAETGTGLGLPISQRLVELMGGRIAVKSKMGQGSQFSFELKFEAVPDDLTTAPLHRVKGYEGRRQRGLIVDDVDTNRTILSEMLQVVGFDIEEVSTGEDALTAHARQPADFVLLDLRLPGINGEEVARKIRPPGQTRPRLIAVSASVFDIDQNNARQVGCDAFVPKPVDEDVLFKTIARQLALTWVTEAMPVPNADSGAPFVSMRTADEIAQLELPSRSELEGWLELARRSDQRRLREAIDASNATGPDRTFRLELDRLLQRFRTGEVREIIAQTLASRPESDA